MYRRRLWRVVNGEIDVDAPPLEDLDQPAPGPPPPNLRTPDETDISDDDDSESRRAIAEAPASARMLVEAGPGTGKTEMAALRIARLLREDLAPGQLLVLSFSRSAVRTLTRRLARIGETDAGVVEELRHLSIRTFDSWAFRMLRFLGESPRALLSRSHDSNVAALTALIGGPRQDDVRAMIGPRQHLIVDEFQDLPGVRGDLVLSLLTLLAPPGQKGCGFTILGDPAQAIYGFARGMRKDGSPFPNPQEYWRLIGNSYEGELRRVALTRNYRADASLARLSSKLRQVLLGDESESSKLEALTGAISALPSTSGALGRAIVEGTVSGTRAILTRTNGEALRVLQRVLGRELEGPNRPIRLKAGGNATLPPAWIGALLRRLRSATVTKSQFERIHAHLTAIWGEEACMRLSLPSETIAWSRLARASGVPEDTTSIDLAELRARLTWPDAFPDDHLSSEEGVTITTVHQSKGMEFDVVLMLEAAPPEEDDEEDGDEDVAANIDAGEQASVAYVGITRAAHALERIGRDQIYRPPTHWKFDDGRRRLCSWSKGWINMEIGLRGDIDPLGFVDPSTLGGAEGVEKLQSFLLAEALNLECRQVILRKAGSDGKAFWNIHLQEGTKPGLLIGRTSQQLSRDLLKVLYGRGYPLPLTIMNLRISSVGTVTAIGDDVLELAEPERTSGLWLGVGLFGTGDFQTKRERAK